MLWVVINVDKEEREVLKKDIMSEVKDMFSSFKENIAAKETEQDKRIEKLCYVSETQNKNLEELLTFMKEQQNKPNEWLSKVAWLIIGAGISLLASFFKK